jgi:hypothetical protein
VEVPDLPARLQVHQLAYKWAFGQPEAADQLLPLLQATIIIIDTQNANS